jgi:hypothetical protein
VIYRIDEIIKEEHEELIIQWKRAA